MMTFISVRKKAEYKLYKVFGFEFKVMRSSYRKMFKLKEELTNRYQVLRDCFRNRKEKKYRVGFLVAHIQKWKCQSVFDLMKKENGLTPVIVVVPDFWKDDAIETIKMRMAEIQEYCQRRNMDYVVSWDDARKEATPLDSFDLDIVFYEQPWDINKIHQIKQVSKRSLTCYVPYYVPNYGNLEYDCKAFHQQLFRYYVFNQSWKDLYLSKMGGCEDVLCPVGHPTLDFYLENKNQENKRYVIYAPHHSFGSSSIGFGTFEWSGRAILEFAKKHPEFNWLYKPHPNTKKELVRNNIMSQAEVEDYWSAWEEIGGVYEGGEYLPLFQNSSCLITDCGSFLVEYFYTGNPVIHMISGRAQEPVPALKEIIDCYYKVTTKEDLLLRMTELLVNKSDPMKLQRLNKVESLSLGQQSCASNIVQDIKNILGLGL